MMQMLKSISLEETSICGGEFFRSAELVFRRSRDSWALSPLVDSFGLRLSVVGEGVEGADFRSRLFRAAFAKLLGETRLFGGDRLGGEPLGGVLRNVGCGVMHRCTGSEWIVPC